MRPKYISKESSPKENIFIWSYEIQIKNLGFEKVQLVFRYWNIIDGNDKPKHVQGPGVVGLQPIINPNETFTYSSFCTLINPSGSMMGKFEFSNSEGEHFFVQIPKFDLKFPVQLAYSQEL